MNQDSEENENILNTPDLFRRFVIERKAVDFAELRTRLSPILSKFLRSRFPPLSEASCQDILADIFKKLYFQPEKFGDKQDGREPLPKLVTSVRNSAIDEIRRTKKLVELEPDEEIAVEPTTSFPVSEEDIERYLSARGMLDSDTKMFLSDLKNPEFWKSNGNFNIPLLAARYQMSVVAMRKKINRLHENSEKG